MKKTNHRSPCFWLAQAVGLAHKPLRPAMPRLPV